MEPRITGLVTSWLLLLWSHSQAATLNYDSVDPAGFLDTTVAGVPARLIQVTDDDFTLQADTSLTINIGFRDGQALGVLPATNPPGVELLNLALVSSAVNGSPPSGPLSGTVNATTAGDFLPGSGVANPFDSNFVPNSPLVGSDVILLRLIGNLTDTGYALQSLQYQIDIPAGFADYPITGINLLVTGSEFTVVPVPATLPLLLSAMISMAAMRRKSRTSL